MSHSAVAAARQRINAHDSGQPAVPISVEALLRLVRAAETSRAYFDWPNGRRGSRYEDGARLLAEAIEAVAGCFDDLPG